MPALLLEDATVIGLLKRREAAGQADFDAQANPRGQQATAFNGDTDCGTASSAGRQRRRAALSMRTLCRQHGRRANVYPPVLSTRNPRDAKHHDRQYRHTSRSCQIVSRDGLRLASPRSMKHHFQAREDA